MNTLTLDIETYYAQDYTLSKMTTAEYIRHFLFQIQGVGFMWNSGPVIWHCDDDQLSYGDVLRPYVRDADLVIVQNAFFDGAVLEWIVGLTPKKYFCTKMAANACIGPLVRSVSLDNQAKFHGLPEKGGYLSNVKGHRLNDLSTLMRRYLGEYCKQDVMLCRQLYEIYAPQLDADEQDLIDLTIKKFTRPKLEIDRAVLAARLDEIRLEKAELIFRSGCTPEELRSAAKFKDALERIGVDCPMKPSPTHPEIQIPALAKTDDGMKRLQEHPNKIVVAIAEARLGVKSNIEESRTERFMNLADLDQPFSVPLNYYAAHTGRFGGTDKLNVQNLPRGGELRRSLVAPEGYLIVAGDLSQIEARILAWLAGQDELVRAFAAGRDVYVEFAAQAFNTHPDHVTPAQRFIAKVCILGLGYGLGQKGFHDHLVRSTSHLSGVEVTVYLSAGLHEMYRRVNNMIVLLWTKMERRLRMMQDPECLNTMGPLTFVHNQIVLPNGRPIRYENLRIITAPNLLPDGRWAANYGSRSRLVYDFKGGVRDIYGAKASENVVQALARIVIAQAELRLARKNLPAALQVHDELVYVVKTEKADRFAKVLEKAMTVPLDWAEGLPLAAEVNMGKTYGDCK